MKLEHLPEPELEFSGGGRHVDVRFGLNTFGPLDRAMIRAPGDIKVGVVGTAETVEGITDWLERCRRGVEAKPSRQPNLFPPFPGFSRETAFGVDLVLDSQLAGVVHARDLAPIVARADRPEAVDEAVAAFLDECRHLTEPGGVDVLVCAPPADLLEALERGEEMGSGDDDEKEEEEEEGESPEPQRAFHDVLKARGLVLPVPIQMVRPETYNAAQRRHQQRHPERARSLQDEATRAWNFHVALYYKAGGTPWRLAREADEYTTCYVGVSFYKTPDNDRVMTSMAQVFNARGDGVIVRGGPARIAKEDRQLHLEQEDAQRLLEAALRSYRVEHKTLPARVVAHKSSAFNAAELAGFREAAAEQRVSSLDLLSLRRGSTRLFRFGYYPPLRGTMLTLDELSSILYLKGSVDFFTTWPGMYVPRPLEVRWDDVEQTRRFLAQEMLALSKQNWNNTQFDGGWPITLRAAHQVGTILKHVDEGEPIQARYAFYM